MEKPIPSLFTMPLLSSTPPSTEPRSGARAVEINRGMELHTPIELPQKPRQQGRHCIVPRIQGPAQCGRSAHSAPRSAQSEDVPGGAGPQSPWPKYRSLTWWTSGLGDAMHSPATPEPGGDEGALPVLREIVFHRQDTGLRFGRDPRRPPEIGALQPEEMDRIFRAVNSLPDQYGTQTPRDSEQFYFSTGRGKLHTRTSRRSPSFLFRRHRILRFREPGQHCARKQYHLQRQGGAHRYTLGLWTQAKNDTSFREVLWTTRRKRKIRLAVPAIRRL